MQSCSIVQSQLYIGKWVYMGRVFAAAVVHCVSSHKAYNVTVTETEAETVKQYEIKRNTLVFDMQK